MGTKPLLLAFLAACGVSSGAAANPNEKAPPEDEVKGHYFCCQTVDKLTGEGCVTIGANQVDSCNNVLYCEGSFMKKDGKVYCE